VLQDSLVPRAVEPCVIFVFSFPLLLFSSHLILSHLIQIQSHKNYNKSQITRFTISFKPQDSQKVSNYNLHASHNNTSHILQSHTSHKNHNHTILQEQTRKSRNLTFFLKKLTTLSRRWRRRASYLTHALRTGGRTRRCQRSRPIYSPAAVVWFPTLAAPGRSRANDARPPPPPPAPG
jgi:hypothetical protein